jgi:carbon-monoxide dehydrogenase medium subunit
VTFEYVEPADLETAIDALTAGDGEAVAVAGGTAVALMLKQGLIRPDRVVGLRRLDELRGIHTDGDALWIGALTTHRAVEASPVVRGAHPALAAAFGAIATIRIRNQATIGGNLAHADPAQDPPPILIALSAVVVIAGRGGARREVPVEDFFAGYFETVLEPGELVLGVRIPYAAAGTKTTFTKFLPRSVDDYATVAVAASARLDPEGRIAHVRIALGAVDTVPVRAHAVETALLGTRPDPVTLGEAAALVRTAIAPLDDVRGSSAYKREMAVVWLRRALVEVTA